MLRCAFLAAMISAFVLVGFPQASADTYVSGHDQAERRRTYEDFYKYVEKIVRAGRQVAEGQKEQTDIRAIQFYLTKLRRAIDAGDWKQAEEVWDKMKSSPSLQRSNLVAADAKRRLTVRQRADEERRHKEEMTQRERIHQAQMRQQQAILNELKNRRNN